MMHAAPHDVFAGVLPNRGKRSANRAGRFAWQASGGPGYALVPMTGVVLLWLVVTGGFAGSTCHAAPFQVSPPDRPEQLTGGMSYTAPTALSFDTRNRPYMFHADDPDQFGFIRTLRDGQWTKLSFVDDLRSAFPDLQPPAGHDKHASGTLTIDDTDHLYAIVYVRPQPGAERRPVLLYSASPDGTFDVHEIPGSPDRAFLEVRTGNHVLNRPPALGTLTFRKSHPAKWASYFTLSVLLPQKRDGHLDLRAPIPITDRCFGISNHSGGYSFAVTTGRKTHLAYAEIPSGGEGGNPTFAATVDRRNGVVVSRKHLVTAPPDKTDVHSTPVIAADADGYLHVLSGAHGGHFKHVRSVAPDRISKGWSEPVELCGRQTYATLAFDGRNRMHTVFRWWSPRPEPQPYLTQQVKAARSGKWSEKRHIVDPPAGHEGGRHGVFFHRLFVDRRGHLYLSFTFWKQGFGDGEHYARLLVTSDDGGANWKRATRSVFSGRRSDGGK